MTLTVVELALGMLFIYCALFCKQLVKAIGGQDVSGTHCTGSLVVLGTAVLGALFYKIIGGSLGAAFAAAIGGAAGAGAGGRRGRTRPQPSPSPTPTPSPSPLPGPVEPSPSPAPGGGEGIGLAAVYNVYA